MQFMHIHIVSLPTEEPAEIQEAIWDSDAVLDLDSRDAYALETRGEAKLALHDFTV